MSPRASRPLAVQFLPPGTPSSQLGCQPGSFCSPAEAAFPLGLLHPLAPVSVALRPLRRTVHLISQSANTVERLSGAWPCPWGRDITGDKPGAGEAVETVNMQTNN